MGRKSKRQRWPGGYIHRQNDGQPLFIIEREVGGKRYHVSTRCHSLKPAMKHLERFEADPENYKPQGVDEEGEGVFLTDELAREFTAWQLSKGCTRKHVKEVGDRLAQWLEDLERVDLRKASLRDHIKPALEKRGTMRAHRISTIKVFFAWLRKEKHLLRSAEDPTLDLPVPQAIPAKRRRRKAVELERVEAVLAHLGPIHRDILTLVAGTGWHFTEVERFASRAESEINHVRRGTTIAVLVMRHKNGEMVQTPVVDAEVLAAAERLRGLGKLPRELPPGAQGKPMRPNQAIAYACAKAHLEPFTLGQMRATVGTWLSERGMTREQVAAFLHHKDPRTTERFYLDVEIPTVPVSPPHLRLVRG